MDQADEVEKLRCNLRANAKPLAELTITARVNEKLKEMKSRQLWRPPLGPFSSLVTTDPLHLMIRAATHEFMSIMTICAWVFPPSFSHFSVDDVVFVQNCPYADLLNGFVRCASSSHMQREANSLSDMAKHYFTTKSFDMSLTGRMAKVMTNSFPIFLRDCFRSFLSECVNDSDALIRFLATYYRLCLLREIAVLSSQSETSSTSLFRLEQVCWQYFVCRRLFAKVYNSAWIIGTVLPAHAKKMFHLYKLGPGIMSCQAEEAKHVFVNNYYKYTDHKDTYRMVMRLDLIKTEYILCNSTDKQVLARKWSASNNKPSYAADVNFVNMSCYCGAKNCIVCVHPFMSEIVSSVDNQKISEVLYANLKTVNTNTTENLPKDVWKK